YRTNRTDEVAHSAPLQAFRERMDAADLHETWDYADFGTVHAAFLLGRLLGSRRIDVGMKHSVSLDWQDVWNSNVVFIGKPDLNPIIRSFLAGRDFIDELGTIRNVRPQPGEVAEYVSAATHGSGLKYAVITRVPGPQPGRHLLLLNAAGAELMWALAESVTNPALVTEMLAPLRLPSGKYAENFQAVIQAAFQSNVPVKIRCVAQHVLAAP
ncbi:MAG TPA: hypothetical protein VG963_05550, partial [Polyangiaceae bacterium]|nr:hypothetical protein [Polyangiaceae bacterium]